MVRLDVEKPELGVPNITTIELRTRRALSSSLSDNVKTRMADDAADDSTLENGLPLAPG